jgi:hypothetical protein
MLQFLIGLIIGWFNFNNQTDSYLMKTGVIKFLSIKRVAGGMILDPSENIFVTR